MCDKVEYLSEYSPACSIWPRLVWFSKGGLVLDFLFFVLGDMGSDSGTLDRANFTEPHDS